MDLRKEVAYALSDDDIMELMDENCRIETYPNLINYNSIEELLEPFDCCFLLFELKPFEGHWVLIHRLPNGHIEFFNSYGGKGGKGGYPDDCLDYIPKKYRGQSNQDFPYLSKLLYESPAKIDYNQYKFQRSGNEVRTCGRWCIIRRLLKDIKLSDFAKIFKIKNGDEVVTYLTTNLDNF